MPDHQFDAVAQPWLRDLENRADPLSPASLATYRSHVKKLLTMIDAETPIQVLHNGFLKDLAAKMRHLSPKRVHELLLTLTNIVASVVDPVTLESVYKREWNWTKIGTRKIRDQKRPSVTKEQIEAAIAASTSHAEGLLYAVLAGTGLRRSEVRSLRVGPLEEGSLSCWLPDESLIRVRSTMYGDSELAGHTKTDSSKREVDICEKLNNAVKDFVSAKKIGVGAFLFQGLKGRPLSAGVIAKKARLRGISGLHRFRRFRVSVLRAKPNLPDLTRFWIGHSVEEIGDIYSKISEDVALRKSWAEKCALGFSLSRVGHPVRVKLGRPKDSKTKPRPVPAPVVHTAEPEPASVHVSVQEPAVANLPPREPEVSERVSEPVQHTMFDDLECAKKILESLGGRIESR